jgi:hypothetical protein
MGNLEQSTLKEAKYRTVITRGLEAEIEKGKC